MCIKYKMSTGYVVVYIFTSILKSFLKNIEDNMYDAIQFFRSQFEDIKVFKRLEWLKIVPQ